MVPLAFIGTPASRRSRLYTGGGWRIADLENGEQQAECPVPANAGMLAWHPDGRHLAVGTDHPPAVEIYDTVTRRMVARRCTGIRSAGVVPTFNHAGDLLVTNNWGDFRQLWEPASGTELLHMAARDGNFFIVSPDDRTAAFTMEGQNLHILRIARGAAREFAVALPENKMEMREHGARSRRARTDESWPWVHPVEYRSSMPHSGLELAIVPDREPLRFDTSGAPLDLRRRRISPLAYAVEFNKASPSRRNSTEPVQ